MNRSWIDQTKQTKELFTKYWGDRSSKQKGLIIGTFLFLFVTFSTFIFFASRTQYVPLYTGQLTQREIGDIKAELDKQGFTDYKLSDNGTMLHVPHKEAPELLVSLAAEGYPKDNKINFDIFSQNLTFGATDRQYEILEREAMQNQLSGVLETVDGIKNAEVILTLPEESVFIRKDNEQTSSASVIVDVEPGVQLTAPQIKALYTLVSRSVPNLPLENITIVNQYSEQLALEDTQSGDQSVAEYDEQRKIQQNVQRDIQQSIQNLLGTILGTNKVYVHTFVRLNFDKVKTEEKLVQPTDGKNNGIAVSSEKLSKSYTGEGASAGGVVGTGPDDVPGYVGANTGGENSYEELQDRVNYEVNRVQNEIIKSPYKIEDITINVGVEPPNSDGVTKLATETEENIRNIVANTVRTALGHPELTDEDVNQRITIFPHTFAESSQSETKPTNQWLYLGGAVAAAILLLLVLVVWLLRRNKSSNVELEALSSTTYSEPFEEPNYFAEQDMGVESQLKKLLEQRPKDFTNMIKTWLNEEEA
jgi:flagellar M-ring protein FliF